jgi:hypothetical protein
MNAVQNWINDTLVPTLQAAWSWLSEKIGDALTWLRDKGWPLFGDAMNAVQNWINDTLVPALTTLWTWLSPKLNDALTWLTQTGWPLLQTAMTAVWTWMTGTLFPALETLWTWLSPKLNDALTWLTQTGWPELQGAMTSVYQYITQSMIPGLQSLHSELERRGVYDDMYVALWNIGNALSQINQYLPTTSQAFNDAVRPAYDFAGGVKAISSAFAEWSKTGPYAAVDAFNQAVYLIRHTIWEGLKEIYEAMDWIGKASGIKVPGLHLPEEPQPPEPVQRPSGNGGGGGGESPPAEPPAAPEPPPRAPSPPPPAPAPSPAPPPSDALHTGNEVHDYIVDAARARGIDPSTAVHVADTEGSSTDKMRVGIFSTGRSFWPFQLHYGGAGTPWASWGDTAGMGNDFTASTGWQPYDVNAWKASTDWALNVARNDGWRQWYGAAAGGIGRWQGIPGHAAGGWVGLNGPELGWLGERGPELVVPNSALRGGAGSGIQVIHMPIVIGGQTIEEIYITGRDLAVRRGRTTAGYGTPSSTATFGVHPA